MANKIEDNIVFEKVVNTKNQLFKHKSKIKELNNLIFKEQLVCLHPYKISITNPKRNSDSDYYICQCLCCEERTLLEKDTDLLLDENKISLDEYIDSENFSMIIEDDFENDILGYMQKSFDNLIMKYPSGYSVSNEYILEYMKEKAIDVNSYLNAKKKIYYSKNK